MKAYKNPITERTINMKKIFPVILILCLLTASCGKNDEHSDKLQVYTSFYAMYDFARTIGSDDAEVYNAVPTGTEPHDFEPTAAQTAKFSKADIFIYNGFGIDAWAQKIASTLPSSVNIVCASEEFKDKAKSNDPHVWLSFENAEKELETVYKALSSADSDNAQNYLNRLNEYTLEIDALKKEYKNAGLEGMKIFVTHGAYGYLCDEFNMEQVALESVSGSGDPSPAQMASMVEEIKNEGAKCVFYDPLDGDKLAKSVAKEAGVEAAALYTFEGDGENRDYVTVMKENLNQLQKAKN